MSAATRPRLFFVPNSVTAVNTVVGFLSMLAAADGRFRLAVYLLLVAIFLDMADGRLARKLGVTSKFGQEMDSLSDSLSFCAAPAFLVHQAIFAPWKGYGVMIAVAYVLAGVYRLARFNLLTDEHEKSRHTLGVTTPIAAGYLMVLALMADSIPTPAAAVVVLTMAMLMISRLPLPEVRTRGFVGFAFLVGMVSYLVVVAWPRWYTVALWNLWNVVILLSARAEDRREANLAETSS